MKRWRVFIRWCQRWFKEPYACQCPTCGRVMATDEVPCARCCPWFYEPAGDRP